MLKIKNEGTRAEVYIYGSIGKDWFGDGNSAEDFAKQLNELSPKPLDIRIDSGGGDVYEAFAICSAIQRYEGETVAYIDGLAASAASYIAVVCDKIVMNDYAFLMIHNAWTYCCGNADYLLDCAERLNLIDSTLASIYEKRSDFTLDEIKELMAAETWFTAQDALDHNLAQEVIETEERMAAFIDTEIAAHYNNVPAAISVRDNGQNEQQKIPSHPVSKLNEKVDEPKQEATATYLLLDGKVFRKETSNV